MARPSAEFCHLTEYNLSSVRLQTVICEMTNPTFSANSLCIDFLTKKQLKGIKVVICCDDK